MASAMRRWRSSIFSRYGAKRGEVVGGLGFGPRLLGDGLQLGDGGHQVGGDAARDVVRLARLLHGSHAIRIRVSPATSASAAAIRRPVSSDVKRSCAMRVTVAS